MGLPKAPMGVIVLVGAILAACHENPDGTFSFDEPLDSPLGASFVIAPDELAFTHVVRESPCPQLVGRIRIRNAGSRPATVTVRGDSRLGLQQPGGGLVDRRDVPVDAGRTVEVEIYFACSTQRSFESDVQVRVGSDLVKTVKVKATIRPAS